MASQPKFARTLTKNEQKKTIKGIQKPKKNVVKNTLESPFALDWPVISSEHEGEIRSLLQKSCSGLKKLTCKPPWKEVVKFKGADRKAFLKEYQKRFLENLDPSDVERNKEREDSLSHLIFGFNAVMRTLEKGCIVGVLVKKNVEPPFIVKAFLPCCANKGIPLVPLDDLDGLLKSEETLAIPHACMVLGLKPSVKDERSRFYSLFAKMCEVVHVETEDDSDEDFVAEKMECSIENSTEDDKENKKFMTNSQLTVEQIQLYHLKRTHKGKRAFIPGKRKEQNVDIMGFGSNFISFGRTEMEVFPNTEKQQLDRKPTKLFKKKLKETKKKKVSHSTLETVDSSSMFFLDDGSNDEAAYQERGKNDKQESSGLELKTDGKEKCLKKKKAKVKKSKPLNYVSAKAKKVKSNPNRKKS